MRTPVLMGSILAALWLAPAVAWADEMGEAEPVKIDEPVATTLQPVHTGSMEPVSETFTGRDAIRDWQKRRRWRYGTQNLYPLTRGMEDAGIPNMARWALHPFTVAFDTGDLVFGAIGGLYGD